ncbi:MAG: hydantoinase/oxoprolinase family protein [Chromatiales bacterium]|jgi:N-methylhydantoinase A
MNKSATLFLGVDTGGTFTDFVLYDGQSIRTHKVLSTPQAPEQAILQGIRELGLEGQGLQLVHGSTVATNAVLEGKGVRTAYVTNRGLADVLSIGRQARRELYNLQPQPIAPPVAEELCLELDCRMTADGKWLARPDARQLQQLVEKIAQLQVRAVAINLLFSYLDASVEQQLRELLPKGLFVSLSSEVLPEIGEYERGMATWLNAWVGPLIEGYIQRLQQALPHSHVAVMQSSGETMAAGQAAKQAVRMLLSGPAGGLVGAKYVAAASGRQRLMTFDMGGTSTDVALIDGDFRLTRNGKIDFYPVAVPMVDMHTIGAGGGSIARLDAGGMLQVGPESAGAQPGPVCYGQGGEQPTVTDANLLLGRIPDDAAFGGSLKLDVEAAQYAMQRLAQQTGLSVEQTAAGIVRIANEHMARALRRISVQKGYDPRDFTLVCFGGAGGMHVCALAEDLGMSQALVPANAGVLSALGMLVTSPGRQLSRTRLTLLEQLDVEYLQQQFELLHQQGVADLLAEGQHEADIRTKRSLDLRYAGQSNTLNIAWSGSQQVQSDFHRLHEQRFGHALDMPVELVNIRVQVSGAGLRLDLSYSPARAGQQNTVTSNGVPVYQRDSLTLGQRIDGPAIVAEDIATTWVASGWYALVDEFGNLLLQVAQVDTA